MQSMMNALEEGSNLVEQDETLQKFYDSVRKRGPGNKTMLKASSA
jgi:hypothetical protein